MPAFVITALVGAGIATGVGVALSIPAVMANVGLYFFSTFMTGVVLGGLPKKLPKKPSDE